jgi:3',5'-cyclic AMP phosphodiesterase CpdA
VIRRFGLAWLLVAIASSSAATSGFVFEDVDGDGVRDDGEPGIAGVAVARGAAVVRTDAAGRYELPPATGTAFIVLTRPAGFDCAAWYRVDPGDFALVRRTPDGESFVFAHITDTHISNAVGDYAEFAVPGPIAAMPRWLSGVAMGWMLRFQDPDYSSGRVARAMHAAVMPYRDVRGWSNASVLGEWVRLLSRIGRDGAPTPIDPLGDFQASLDEVQALAPRFVISTGDLVLESNKADPRTANAWMHFYRERTAATGLRFYDTIGNNEIVGSDRDDLGPGAPGYGKALFRSGFGPTWYSFDRGELHFVALDTHVLLDPEDGDWSFTRLGDDAAAWLEADLAAHAGRSVVVLNHEPLRGDPTWSTVIRHFALVDPAVAERLEAAGVRWTFTGHLHVNGVVESGPTQHISTGALSGMRWSLPAEAFARGYRLVQVRDDELFSAWKRTGEPLFGFVDPPTDAALHATSSPRPSGRADPDGPPGPTRVVIVAADASGPFVGLDVRLDGRPLPVERWSAYFAGAHYDPAELDAAEHTLVAEARRADGSVLRIRTRVRGAGG